MLFPVTKQTTRTKNKKKVISSFQWNDVSSFSVFRKKNGIGILASGNGFATPKRVPMPFCLLDSGGRDL